MNCQEISEDVKEYETIIDKLSEELKRQLELRHGLEKKLTEAEAAVLGHVQNKSDIEVKYSMAQEEISRLSQELLEKRVRELPFDMGEDGLKPQSKIPISRRQSLAPLPSKAPLANRRETMSFAMPMAPNKRVDQTLQLKLKELQETHKVEMASKKEQIKQLSEEKAELEREIQSLNKQLTTAHVTLARERTSSKEEHAAHEVELSTLRDQLAAAHKDRLQLKEELVEVRVGLSAKRDECNSLQHQLGNLQTVLSKERAQRKQQEEELQSSLDAAKEECSHLQHNLAGVQSSLGKEKAARRDDAMLSKSQLDERDAQIASLSKDLKKERAKRKEEHALATTTVEERDRALANAQQHLLALQQALEKEQQKSKEEVARVRGMMTSLEERLRNELTEAQLAVENANAVHAANVKDLDQKMLQAAKLFATERSDWEAKEQALQRDLAELRDFKETSKEAAATAKEYVEQLESGKEEMEEAMRELRANVLSLEQELRNARTQLNALPRLEAEVEGLSSENRKVRGQLAALSSQTLDNERLRADLAAAQARINQLKEVRVEAGRVVEERERAAQEAVTLRRELDDTRAKLAANTSKTEWLEVEVRDTVAKLRAAEDTLKGVESQLCEARSEADKYKTRASKLSSSLTAAKNLTKTTKAEADKWKNLHALLEGELAEKQKDLEQVNSLYKQSKRKSLAPSALPQALAAPLGSAMGLSGLGGLGSLGAHDGALNVQATQQTRERDDVVKPVSASTASSLFAVPKGRRKSVAFAIEERAVDDKENSAAVALGQAQAQPQSQAQGQGQGQVHQPPQGPRTNGLAVLGRALHAKS